MAATGMPTVRLPTCWPWDLRLISDDEVMLNRDLGGFGDRIAPHSCSFSSWHSYLDMQTQAWEGCDMGLTQEPFLRTQPHAS